MIVVFSFDLCEMRFFFGFFRFCFGIKFFNVKREIGYYRSVIVVIVYKYIMVFINLRFDCDVDIIDVNDVEELFVRIELFFFDNLVSM